MCVAIMVAVAVTLNDYANLSTCKPVGTTCPASFSQDGFGCCPYQNAVCCANRFTCCPARTECKDLGFYQSICVDAVSNESAGLAVCKPGAALPFSTVKPNVLIIGDSVSIGYTPLVATRMQTKALVQHSPLDVRDGGAEETAYGLQCLNYMLRSPNGTFLRPDVIMFNWGLHDGPLGNRTVPGQAGLPAVYSKQLEMLTVRLKAAEPQAKLLFALTSPSLCDPTGDGCVVDLNNQAAAIMRRHSVPTVDLHDAIVKECGPANAHSACWGLPGCFCPHCNEGGTMQGYDWLAATVIVPALTALLPNE